MVERTPFLDVLTQVLLFLGLLVALAPFAIVASSTRARRWSALEAVAMTC